MATHPKVLGLTLDPKLTYSTTHIHTISVHAHKPLQIIKALTATGYGKQKETIMATYKAIMRPALEYASSIWSPLASSTSINKLQVMHNAALRTVTGCTQDTNIQHLHDETFRLPIHEHLQFHASQYKHKTQHPSHPLHKHITYFNAPRLKHPLFLTTAATQQTSPSPPHRTNKYPFLKSYLHNVDAKSHPSPRWPLCNTHTHDTHHLFNCTHIRTTLSPLDLWTDPAGVMELLARWRDCWLVDQKWDYRTPPTNKGQGSG